MIYARLQIGDGEVSEDRRDEFDVSETALDDPNTPFRINGRLSVLDDSIKRLAFDTVQLCLRGVITSSIGYRHALEDIITLTDIKAASDFKPTPSTPTNPAVDDSQKGRHVDFYFELPARTQRPDGSQRPLPLSFTVSGSTSLTRNSALNDNQVVRGECEVSYWVEAQFRRAGRQVGFLNQHVAVPPAVYPRLRASLAKAQPLTLRAKPDMLARCRLQRPPELALTLRESLMTIERDPTTGKRHISLALALAMDTASGGAIDSRQSFKCSVEAKWEVNTRFSIVRAGGARFKPGEAVSKTSTASTLKSSILFRPLPQYEAVSPSVNDRTSTTKSPRPSYVAASQIDLPVPDALSQPSLKWDYLLRTYSLDLSLSFHGVQGAPKYSLRTNLPITVSSYATKAEDAQKDQVMVAVTETALPSPSDDEEEDEHLDQLTAALSIDNTNGPRSQPPRPVTRTPPPPYFR